MEDQKNNDAAEQPKETLETSNQLPEEAGPREMLKMMRNQGVPFMDAQIEGLKKLPIKDQCEFVYRLLMQTNSMLTQLWEIEQVRAARMRQMQGAQQPKPSIIMPKFN